MTLKMHLLQNFWQYVYLHKGFREISCSDLREVAFLIEKKFQKKKKKEKKNRLTD